MIIVRINKDGSMNDIKIDKVTKTNIMGKLKKCANNTCAGGIKELYYWNHEENIIKCYGWYEGEVGFENKHDLIPGGISDFLEEDSSEKLLFGDIFLVKKNKQKNLINFLVSDYANMYSELFEGFDDCVSEDEEEESESEDEEDKDFIVPDSAEESEDSYEYKEDDELDTDENEY